MDSDCLKDSQIKHRGKKDRKKKSRQHGVGGGGEKTASWEVEEVLHTRTSGIAKSRSAQNHRAKDLAPPAGSASCVRVPGHFRRRTSVKNEAHQTSIPLISSRLLVRAQLNVSYF